MIELRSLVTRAFLPGILFACTYIYSFAQETALQDPAVETNVRSAEVSDEPRIKQVLDNYTNSVFQEKVFVHTDKDSYLAGETIWMRAHRMDAMNHFPQYYSGIVYFDIRDSKNELVKRMLVIKNDSCFQASYKTEPDMATGYYDLIAYTNWMQNFDTDFYFRKKLYVLNMVDNNVASSISFDPVQSGGNVNATVKIIGSDGEPYRGIVANVWPYIGEQKQDPIVRNMSRQGEITFPLRLNTGVTGVEVAFQGDKPMRYSKYFELPGFDYKFDVQFMPEGGHLLEGVMQNIGFKAIGSDGKSIEISGTVVDESGDEVAVFSSLHLGMGSFVFQSKGGERYTAKVTTVDGHEASFELPVVAQSGVALNTSIRGDVLTCRVLSTAGYNLSGLYVGFHSRGKSYRWIPVEKAPSFNLPVSSLPEGVLTFFIIDEAGKVFSERLVLINKDSSPQVNVVGLRPNYGPRQKVDVNLEVFYGGNIPMPSEMSISVVDPKTAPQNKGEDNILSYVLLSSDIKGKIENPSYYFDKSVNAAQRSRAADLLMMIQGWRRFDIETILSKELPRLDYAIELGQNISGTIKRRLGNRAVDDGNLSVMGTNKETNTLIATRIDADEQGNFTISDISFPDNTTFVVQGKQANKQNVEVVIEPQNFRNYTSNRWDWKRFYDPADIQPVDSLAAALVSSGRRYIYENGERTLALDAATVVGERETVDPQEEQYTNLAGKPTTGTEIDEESFGNLRLWIESKGLQIEFEETLVDGIPTNGEVLYIRGKQAVVFIDGMKRSFMELMTTPIQMIDKIWIFRDGMSMASAVGGAATIGGPSAMTAPPGLVVTTKRGEASPPRESLSFFRFTPMGYSVPDKFYSPKYEAGSKDNGIPFDERSTVYWNPNVTTERDGKANISFYTTDVSARFIMTIQGMTDNGLPIYAEVPINATF